MAGRRRLIEWDGNGEERSNESKVEDCTVSCNTQINGNSRVITTLGQHRTYKEGAFKALDQVIKERNIPKPESKYKSNDSSDGNVNKIQCDRIYSSTLNPRTSFASSNRQNQRGDHDATDGRARRIQIREIDKTFSISKKGTRDPRSCSLDDIIEERIVIEGESEDAEQKKSDNYGDTTETNGIDLEEDGDRSKRQRLNPKHVLTPYQTVTFLQEMGMIFEFEIGKNVVGEWDDWADEESIRKWRCIVACGAVKGVADCVSKPLARELACDSFLKNLQKIYPSGKIPYYEVSDELFLDSVVYEELQKLFKQLNISIWHELKAVAKQNETQGAPTEYTYVYYIRDKEILGKGTSEQNAQLKAAYNVYEYLRGEAFPKIVGFTDEMCDLKADYDFTEAIQDETVQDLNSPELIQVFAELRKEILEKVETLESV